MAEDLSYICGKSKKTDWTNENLAMYAERFLKKGGMTKYEISALRGNLSKTYPNSRPGTAK